MNEAMQRMLAAWLLTCGLHSILLVWYPQRPEIILPVPEKLTVSLRQPPPPKKRILSEQLHKLPVLKPVQRKPVPHLLPRVQRMAARRPRPAPVLRPVALKPMPHLPPAQGMVATQLRPAPALTATSVPQPLPSLSPRPETVQETPVGIEEEFLSDVKESVETTAESTAASWGEATPPPAGAGHGTQEAAPLYDSNPPPEYPSTARRRGLQGLVIIEALIDISGRMADLRLSASSGHSILDNAALRSVRGWLFKPGTAGGKSREMWVKVPVRFELH